MKSYFRHMLCLVALFLGTTSLAFAQNIVTGTIVDKDGPLMGASVHVKGTTNGTITDMDGQYSLEANLGDELEFSYVGYVTQTIKVISNTLNVTMKEDTEVLSEVVITAMGIKRDRKALGYEVGEVQGAELTKAKETNERIKKTTKYDLLTKDNSITWYSDDASIEAADVVRLSIVEGGILLEFTRPDLDPTKNPFYYPGLLNIRFSNSGSRYDELVNIFNRMYQNLQEYEPDYHQIHLEELDYQKKLLLEKKDN